MVFLTWKEFFLAPGTYDEPVGWIFNMRHVYLIVGVLLTFILLYLILPAKTKKQVIFVKCFFIFNLVVFESLRIFRHAYLYHLDHGSLAGFDWIWAISFQMCAITTWTTAFTLLLSLFLKKDNRLVALLYNFSASCSAVGAFTTFVFPTIISKWYPFFRFPNLQTLIIHILLIFVPIYLTKAKEFKPELKNLFVTLGGYVYVGSIAMSASLASDNNFAFTIEMTEVPQLSVIPFPFHLLFVIGGLILLATFFWGIYALIFHKQKKLADPFTNTYRLESICVDVYGIAIILALAKFLIAGRPTLKGLWCLSALVYLVLMLGYLALKKNKEIKVFDLVFTFITNIFLFFVFLVKFIKKEPNENPV